MNNQQEAFRRFAQQLQRVSQGGGFPGGSPRGLFAGGGLFVALIAGGLALNASLFNGTHAPTSVSFSFILSYLVQTQLMGVTAPSNIPGTRVGGGRRSTPQSLMEVCRLHGVTETVYGEGTHLRVRFSGASVPLSVHIFYHSRFHGSRHLSYSIFGRNLEVSRA
jgi:hypothetical protein